MDAADRERPSTPRTPTPTRKPKPETTETTETTNDDSLALLTPDGDQVCESGYGFGV